MGRRPVNGTCLGIAIAALLLLPGLGVTPIRGVAAGHPALESERASTTGNCVPTLVKSIPVEGGPLGQLGGMLYDGEDGDLYVVEQNGAFDAGDIVVVSGASDSVVGVIPVGNEPLFPALDSLNGNLYVSDLQSNEISVISTSTDDAIAPIPLNSSGNIVYDPWNQFLYVSHVDSPELTIISSQTDQVVDSLHLSGQVDGMVYDAATNAIYVDTPSALDILQGNGTTVTTAIPMTLGYGSFMGLDTQTQDLYVSEESASEVTVISTETDSIIANVTVPGISGASGIAFDSSSGDAFVALDGLDQVIIISGSSMSVLATINVGWEPGAPAFDPSTGQVYVVNAASNNMSVVSASTLTLLATLSLGNNLLLFEPTVDYGNGMVYVPENFEPTSLAVISCTLPGQTSSASSPWVPWEFFAGGVAVGGAVVVITIRTASRNRRLSRKRSDPPEKPLS